MTDISNITCLVVDNGLFVEMARVLARTYKRVDYYCPWESAFPKMNNALIGYGTPDIQLVDSPYRHFDEYDLFVFPDVYHGAFQQQLVDDGRLVWGCRLGEDLELDRVGTKQVMARRGLPVGYYEVVQGMDNLRQYLQDHQNVYVKIDKYRGHFETFHAPHYRYIEPRLDELEHQLGAFKSVTTFVVEDALDDRVEVGVDGYTIDGQFPTKLLAGVEVKDMGYAGKMVDYTALPEPMTLYDRVMGPILRGYSYRGFYSTELRIGKDNVPYMIDQCARAGSPPNELYQEFYTNLPDIIYQGAQGIVVDPQAVARYGAELLIHSSWADKNWQPLDIPADVRQYVKLRNAVFINNRWYVVPQAVGLPEIGSVIGYGDTLQAACDMALEVGKSVEGHYVFLPEDALQKAEQEFAQLKDYGIDILSAP